MAIEMEKGSVSIDAQNIMPVIKRWLYSDKDIFLREVVSNGCDAITKYRMTNPDDESEMSVMVTVDKENKTLTISDTGIGMTEDEVKRYINQVAFSGASEFMKKFEGDEKKGDIIGHFGLGFYSVFMVSENVEIETLSCQEGAEPVHWESKDGMDFAISEGHRTAHGTSIILHISDQLYAFWDQLYNLIHVPTMAKLDQILQAIKDMDINVNVDLDELKSAISSAASKITGQIQSSINSQITNDDKNTDHLENGYDNSGILGDKGKLDGAITEYEKVEDQLLNDAKDKIGKFEFENPFEKYTGPISDISYFLTGIYNGLKGLNIPVSFSLTLTIALVFIGYYRFKGGA